MTTAVKTTNIRPFMMIHFDCFDSKVFDNQSQRTVYMTLKQFADSNNQCFPSVKKIASVALICVRKVQSTLRELQNKFLIGIEERFRADGSQTSNLYTIYDAPGLWTADNAENTKNAGNAGNVKNAKNEIETVKTIIEQCGDEQLVSVLKARGYTISKNDDVAAIPQDKSVLKPVSDNTIIAQVQDESIEENQVTEMEETSEAMPEDVVVQEKESVSNNAIMPEKENSIIGRRFMSELENITKKEKEPTSVPSKATDVSTNNNQSSNNDDTTPEKKSQPLERYSLDWIKHHFGYDIILHDNPACQKDIDAVMDILYTALNTTKEAIRIGGEDKPVMVVIGKLMKLDLFDIKYAMEKFSEQTDKIKNPVAYMLTILYNAPEQHHLDISNQVNHDMYNAVKPAEGQPAGTYQTARNQSCQFHQQDAGETG